MEMNASTKKKKKQHQGEGQEGRENREKPDLGDQAIEDGLHVLAARGTRGIQREKRGESGGRERERKGGSKEKQVRAERSREMHSVWCGRDAPHVRVPAFVAGEGG